MTEPSPSRVPDGYPLRRLDGGLTIVRYHKHDWVAGLDQLRPEQLLRRTDKINGSKFLASWPLDRLTEWMATQIDGAGWTLQVGARYKLEVRLPDPVGLAGGVIVHTIRIVSDGRYAHAYPIQDA